MSNDNNYEKYWDTVPETKTEWDLLPKAVRERLREYVFIDYIEAISASLNELPHEYHPDSIRKELWLPKKDKVKQAWPVKILTKIRPRRR